MHVEQADFVDIPTRDVVGLPQNPGEPTEFEAGNVTLAIWEPEQQGVEFVPSSGVCNMAFCTDPDGNSLILHRRYAPHGQR